VWTGEWDGAGHYYFGGGGDFGAGDEYMAAMGPRGEYGVD
jgi:hypothetical protein